MQKVAWSISDSAGKRCISEYPVCVVLIGLTMITLGGRLGNQTDSEGNVYKQRKQIVALAPRISQNCSNLLFREKNGVIPVAKQDHICD